MTDNLKYSVNNFPRAMTQSILRSCLFNLTKHFGDCDKIYILLECLVIPNFKKLTRITLEKFHNPSSLMTSCRAGSDLSSSYFVTGCSFYPIYYSLIIAAI